MWKKIRDWLFPELKKGDLVPVCAQHEDLTIGETYGLKIKGKYYLAEYAGGFIQTDSPFLQRTFRIISLYEREDLPKKL